MPSINQLTTITTISSNTLIPVYDPANGDARKVSVSALNDYIQAQVSANFSGYVTQYSAPSATGFSVAITDTQDSVHLILTPTAGFAAGTITMPAASNTLDGQRVLVNCTQAVTTLTVAANGATSINGVPTTLAANDFFTMAFDKPTLNWYRIG